MQTDGVSKGGWRQDGATVCASTGPHQWFYLTYTDCWSSFIWAWCKTLTFSESWNWFQVMIFTMHSSEQQRNMGIGRGLFLKPLQSWCIEVHLRKAERLQQHAGGIIWRCCKHVRSLVWSSNRKLVLAQCRREERWGEFVALEFYLDGGCWHKKKKRGKKAICLLLNQHKTLKLMHLSFFSVQWMEPAWRKQEREGEEEGGGNASEGSVTE